MKQKSSFGGRSRSFAARGPKSTPKSFGRGFSQRRDDDAGSEQQGERSQERNRSARPYASRGPQRGAKPFKKRDEDRDDSRDFKRDHQRAGGYEGRREGGRVEKRGDKRDGKRSFSSEKPRGDFRRDDARRDNARRDDRRNERRDDTRRDYRGRDDTKRFDKKREDTGRFERKRDDYKRPEHRRSDARRPDGRRPETRHTETPRTEAYHAEGHLIWGLHAVRAAWLNPARRCHRLWVTEAGRTSMEATLTEGREALLKRPDVKLVERQELDRLTPPGTVHQGIVLDVAALPEPALGDLIAGDTPPNLLLMLDQVTDPHNVGAILRSAAAFGAGGVIMTERNAPGTTGVLAKSASGALEHLPQLHVVNLSRALDELQQAGYWCVGLAEEGERDLSALDLTGRTVLVMGAEGEGLRQLTRKKCNELARLPTGGPIGSLNVSNAAAVALYEWKRQRS